MEISKQLLLHLSPKNEEINGIRRVNYTHATYKGRISHIATRENLSGNPEKFSRINY